MSLGAAGPVHRAVRYGIAACLFVWAGAAYGAELKQVSEKVFPLEPA